MPSQTDRYFVVDDGEPEAQNPKNGKFNLIPTIWGHIGGGANEVDIKWVGEEISQFLSEGVLGEVGRLQIDE
jgi:homoserine O-acetyltransferase